MKLLGYVGLIAAVFIGGSAEAGFSFKAAGPSGGFSTNITANVGQSVQLYLVEDTPLSFTSSGASFRLTPSGSASFVTPVGSTAGWAINTTGSPLQFNNGFGAPSSQTVFGLQAVQVGSLTLSSVGSTTFTFTDIDSVSIPADVAANTGSGTVFIDNQVFVGSPSSFTVTAVPEPSSMALLGIVGAGLAAARRFRRKTMA